MVSVLHPLSSGQPNPIARRRAELTEAGFELTDMTDTNPTRHGLFNPQILEVIDAHLGQASHYDPNPKGPWPARAALAERFGGQPDDYWLTASTSEAYSWLFSLLAEPGDSIAIPAPGYPLIDPLARLHHLNTTAYRTFYVHPSGWELDRSSLETAAADRATRAIVAVNPNNPTGAYAEAGLVEVAANLGQPIIADEVFFPFQPCPPAHRPTRLSGNESTLTFGLDGLSKLLAAPQLKLGWIRLSGPAAQTAIAARALDEIADTFLSVNSPVALSLPDLLGLSDDTITLVTGRLQSNLATARASFPDFRIRTLYGGWMMLLDIPPLMNADALGVALMECAGLYVHPGYFYDLPGSTLAISLLPEPAVFGEACQRLAAAITVLIADACS